MKLLHCALQVSGLLTLSAASPTRTKDSAPTVIVDSGPVVGSQILVAGHFVNKFLGIPFAAPPRRFAPPVPPEPWSEPYHATEYFPACLQQFVRNANATRQWFNTPAPPESEDCLGLNVWAPANQDGWIDYSRVRGKAVLFWIYGVSQIVCEG
jgi:carboxylesterase type B